MKYTDQQLGAYIVLIIFVTGLVISCLYGCVRLYVYCHKPRDLITLLV